MKEKLKPLPLDDGYISPDEHADELIVDEFCKSTASKCELRPGIGLCDECLLPKWPQEYVGYGDMICLDCLNKEKPKQ